MRLQYLEINGFKSFPERADLSFDHGVTAIVGPNGCGKSNVIDAITWALGEQSAKTLRGERMEDIIFSGSDARKPTAAAEVRLNLARVRTPSREMQSDEQSNGVVGGNPDPSNNVQLQTITRDVELGRRLYRSGESEYLIDGEVCRLRDVQDLLMDSGVGIKAYAVIEQGKIGQILGARPIERRQLLEEAAGVTKYKTRRRAAELKLEAAQQNMTRIDDIVFEVKRQRQALKRQAAKARQYRRLREELRRSENVLLVRRYRTLLQAIDVAQTRLVAAQTVEQAAATQVSEGESRHDRLRLELTERESQAAATRDAAHTRELEVGRLKQQIEFDGQRATVLATTCANLKTELETLETSRDLVRLELDKQLMVARERDKTKDQVTQVIAKEEAKYDEARRVIDERERDVETIRSEVFSIASACTTLRHTMDNAAGEGNRLAGDLAKLEVEASDLRIEAEGVTLDQELTQGVLQRAQETLETTRLAAVTRETELVSTLNESASRGKALYLQQHGLTEMTARLKSLDELVATRAGYDDAARVILSETNDSVEHLGSVADYIETDARFERAVEACLSAVLQYILVRHQDQMVEGLRLIRERNLGKCGFLIVEGAVRERTYHAPANASVVPISSVVRITGPYASAIERAINPAWVADSFEKAVAAAEIMTGNIATLDGEVFRGPFLVEGGGKQGDRGILTTKREIKELKASIAIAQDDVTRLGGEVSTLNATGDKIKAEASELKTEQHEQEKVLVGIELRLARAVEENQRIMRKQELVETERRRTEGEKQNLHERQVEAHDSITRLEVEGRVTDERLSSAQQRLVEAREAHEKQGRRTSEEKVTLAALAERSTALVSELTRLEELARELEVKIATRTAEHDQTIRQGSELEVKIRESQQLLDGDVARFESLTEDMRLSDQQLVELRAQVEEREIYAHDARHRLDEQRAIVSELTVAHATALADLSHLSSSCVESFQMSPDQVVTEIEKLEEGVINLDTTSLEPDQEEFETEEDKVGEPTDEDDPEIAGTMNETSISVGSQESEMPISGEDVVERLRLKIERLGPVNLMAIDQFDELETRYEFMTNQRKDLVESINSTGQAIKRIDQSTRERFREAFTAINKHFQETFATLFGGGRAGLVLLDEADLLESGVDIIAQPPGKRLQNVQLLSGGEKALSAMALMFAIFKHKPSPFCLLDEIDAPLDDANISRFVEMLRGMQTQTQFILVTHNRRTMEIADRLYGVTMEEPGVSKLISVQLN